MTETPPFVRWTLGKACPLRADMRRPLDPEETERQLRGLRACFEAERDGRLLDGVCFHESVAAGANSRTALGFPANDLLTLFGGRAAAADCCKRCPANAVAGLAGCFGVMNWRLEEEQAFCAAVHALAAERQEQFAADYPFPPTSPRWHGFWLSSPLSAGQAAWLRPLFDRLASEQASAAVGLSEFAAALTAAGQTGVPLFVSAFPPGRVEGKNWITSPHCVNCRAAADLGAAQCLVCGRAGPPHPGRRRRALGNRPFFPLERFMPAPQAESLLQKYLNPSSLLH